ncbi:hypothetical protein VTL71DRAFT_5600 [Oculimacula yallundae]|uniref:Clr5 domain-containing protein n=1 Tax=Oculimacula yallundae TaxID=86028 RepID=A0ABR4C1K6_9HELO
MSDPITPPPAIRLQPRNFWTDEFLGVQGIPRNRWEMRKVYNNYVLIRNEFNHPDQPQTSEYVRLNAVEMEEVTHEYKVRSAVFALKDSRYAGIREIMQRAQSEMAMHCQSAASSPPGQEDTEDSDNGQSDGESDIQSSLPESDLTDTTNGQHPANMNADALPFVSSGNGMIGGPVRQPVYQTPYHMAHSNITFHYAPGIYTGNSIGQHLTINGLSELDEAEVEEEAARTSPPSDKARGKRREDYQRKDGPAAALGQSFQPGPSDMSYSNGHCPVNNIAQPDLNGGPVRTTSQPESRRDHDSNNQHPATENIRSYGNAVHSRTYSQPVANFMRSSNGHHQQSYRTQSGQYGGIARQPPQLGRHHRMPHPQDPPIQLGEPIIIGGLEARLPVDSPLYAIARAKQEENRARNSDA